jgi:hypothetical protein
LVPRDPLSTWPRRACETSASCDERRGDADEVADLMIVVDSLPPRTLVYASAITALLPHGTNGWRRP